MATIFAWSGALRKRGELDDNAASRIFRRPAGGRSSLQTLDDGIMTKDLVGLCRDMTPLPSPPTQFIAAIRERLEQALR